MKNEIKMAGDSYKDRQVVSGSVVMVQSLDGNELQYDTLNAELELGVQIPTTFRPADSNGFMTSDQKLVGVRPLIRVVVTDPALYKYGEEVIYRHNGALIGKYYMTTITRVGKTRYQITCVSPIGILSNSKHYGGIYNGVEFSSVIEEVVGDVVPFSVAPELANQPVYGWLPIATRRENLHQALFAMGAAAQKDSNGDLYISPLSDDVRLDIDGNRSFAGGSVKYPQKVTQISVSEHAYSTTGGETVTLFEGLVEAESIVTPGGVSTVGTVILFPEPMHSLAVDNGSVIESGVNYAVIAPAANCKLTGKKYAHTVREITRPESVSSGDTDNKITVTNATLVSIANSENVANRLMSYYSSAKTLSADIVVDAERAGSAVQTTDPFGEKTNGIVTSMKIDMGNTLKARTEIVSDYSPGSAGNFYSNVAVISKDGSWVVPSGVSKIRVAIIGGGTGGYSGAKGQSGEDGESFYVTGSNDNYGVWGNGGAGGAKGKGGTGGKILVQSLNVQPGQSFSVSIGQGGSGGVCSGNENVPGLDGTDTTFGEYSSANGIRSATGFSDLFGSTVYGLPGEVGTFNGSNGDSGGKESGPEYSGDSITIAGVTYISGKRAESVSGTAEDDETGYTGSYGIAGGGNGGGSAAGSNGGDGKQGRTSAGLIDQGSISVYCGDGGNGATATINGSDATVFGSGGQGGNGGGGGGGGASGLGSAGLLYWISTYANVVGGKGGEGGLGSNGGNGAQGCVLVYY